MPELVVILDSETDMFLVNHMSDGSDWEFDMAFFQALAGVQTEEDVEPALAQLAR